MCNEDNKTIVITITELTEIKKGNPLSQIDCGIIESNILYSQKFKGNKIPDVNKLIRFANGEEPTTTQPRRRCI